jgi:3-deoxy-manno-octulosonate cytidylyltransferase (CMP-KDO synthetase)
MKIIALIPARFDSKRFPGKALADIMGKPMVQRVYEQATKSTIVDAVYVATDSDAIFSAITDIGGKAIMTGSQCSSGTDRVAEAARTLDLDGNDIVINIQGDQPLLQPECLAELIQPFYDSPGLPMATLANCLDDEDSINDPNNVKVIIDVNGYAIYFSRARIPFDRDQKEKIQYYKHLGIYAYSNGFLQEFTKLSPAPLENIEKLEQLRAIHHGHKIGITISTFDSPSVDDIADIAKVETILQRFENS